MLLLVVVMLRAMLSLCIPAISIARFGTREGVVSSLLSLVLELLLLQLVLLLVMPIDDIAPN